MHWILTLAFGGVVGFSLGLTGGGGAIFAVPLLVYGLGVAPREAVTLSLVAVGVTALIGFLGRWRSRLVEVRTGLVFAAAGMMGAPVGTWLSGLMPEAVLLILFAVLMLAMAARMWTRASVPTVGDASVDSSDSTGKRRPACRRDGEGRLLLTSRCMCLLIAIGIAAGILSGLFGVGGGFVIVPALVLFSGMSIRIAIGTSLMVIALISASGIASHLMAGRVFSIETASLFVAGGVAGMVLGSCLGQYLSGRTLQRVFAVAIVCVAIFVIVRTGFAA